MAEYQGSLLVLNPIWISEVAGASGRRGRGASSVTSCMPGTVGIAWGTPGGCGKRNTVWMVSITTSRVSANSHTGLPRSLSSPANNQRQEYVSEELSKSLRRWDTLNSANQGRRTYRTLYQHQAITRKVKVHRRGVETRDYREGARARFAFCPGYTILTVPLRT